MKKLVSAALALLLTLGTLSGARAAGAAPFSDIPEDHPHREAVEFVYREGIMDGVGGGRFGPDRVLTRAMMVTVLYRMAGEPPLSAADTADPFSDVRLTGWYGSAVYWAKAHGFVTGHTGGRFGPSDNITRQQFVVVLHRFVGSPKATLAGDAFSDTGEIASWARDAVAWAVQQGILTGSGGMLRPKGNVTRAQAAEILMRFVDSSVMG